MHMPCLFSILKNVENCAAFFSSCFILWVSKHTGCGGTWVQQRWKFNVIAHLCCGLLSKFDFSVCFKEYFLYSINNVISCSLLNWGIVLLITKSIFSKHFSKTLKKVKYFWKAYHVYAHYEFPILLILFYGTSLPYAPSNKYEHGPASYFYAVKT